MELRWSLPWADPPGARREGRAEVPEAFTSALCSETSGGAGCLPRAAFLEFK